MRWFTLCMFLVSITFAGCGRQPRETVELTELIARLNDADFIARLDADDTVFISSSDPAGGNNDYNNYLRSGPPGWWVLADLKGPGYISRFWFTGGEPSHRIKLFFDNEKNPRIDATIGEFCGGMEPFLPPLAAYENYCYYNYVPLPYARRLVIMVQEGGTRPGNWPRLFYQVNYANLPRDKTVASLSLPPAPATLAALEKVALSWDVASVPHYSMAASGDFVASAQDAEPPVSASPDFSAGLGAQVFEGSIEASSVWRLPSVPGPAVTREIRITPDFRSLPSSVAREQILRDVVLRIYWDGSAEPSVLTPLGDVGGSVWRRTRYQSLYFGMEDDTWFVRFPMHFAQAMELEFENQGMYPLPLKVETYTETIPGFDGRHGYFHAVWQRSTPEDVGSPHPVLDTEGRGRFIGCILSAVSFDNTFWLLEGDEFMWRDGEIAPFWKGTGLEDYFTGGWYYQNVMARPLHGLPYKNFFRTVQYRVHLPDVINFQTSFRMVFERGPEDNSRGTLESLAWYYLDQPRPVGVELPPPFERQPPFDDKLRPATVMMDLFNYERFNDYTGAREYIDKFLTAYPDYPYAAVLRLRQAAYLERGQGLENARPVLERFLEQPPEDAVREQARMLLDFHDRPQGVLMGFNANMPARVFLDGEVVMEAGAPEILVVRELELEPGRHVLAIQARHKNYPDWLQLYLRTHHGDIFTTPEWRHAVNPSGAWWLRNYNDQDWTPVGGTGCKGPPEEPYVFMEPNAFVDMQSKAIALRPSVDWSSQTGAVVYRRVFEIPEE